jgi:hypothetical protein
MNKDTLTGLQFLSPLFAGFVVLLAALYFRSRYNKAHPEGERTLAQRLRGRIIVWTVTMVGVAGSVYFTLSETNFAPSWLLTFLVAIVAFIVGESVGRWSALRRTDERTPSSTDSVGPV